MKSIGPRSGIRGVALCVVALSAAALAAPTEEQIAEVVGRLGHRSYKTREVASARLWSFGHIAIKQLEAAAKSDDPEVRMRAAAILAKVRYGILPDTPADLLALAEEYRGGDDTRRERAIRALLRKGTPAYAMAQAFHRVEENPALRLILSRWLAAQGSVAARDLLIKGEDRRARELLERGLTSGSKEAVCHYAAFAALRGKLKPAIARFRKSAGQGDAGAHAVLARLLCAAGDWTAARAAAEKAGDHDLLRRILILLQDWKALAAQVCGSDQLRVLGLQAFYRRLAGDEKGFRNAVPIIKSMAESSAPRAWSCARVLLVNLRPDDAAEVCVKGELFRQAFLIRRSRNKRAEAVEALEAMTSQKIQDRLYAARVLLDLGEKKKAGVLIERLGLEVKAKNSRARLRIPLGESLFRMGRAQEAEDLLEAVLATVEAGSPDAPHYAMWAAEIFKKHGRQKRAAEILRSLDGDLRKLYDSAPRKRATLVYGSAFARLAREAGLREAGLTEVAFTHAARALALPDCSEWDRRRLLARLFPKKGGAAEEWRALLKRAYPTETPEGLMARLRALLRGGAEAKGLAEAAAAVEHSVEGRSKKEQSRLLDELAEACREIGAAKRARAFAAKALALEPSADMLMREARRLEEAGKSRRAAERFGQAWALDRGKAGALYLQGRALARAGDAGKGARLMGLAKLLPLADRVKREDLALDMLRSGDLDAAFDQWTLTRRLSPDGCSRDTAEELASVRMNRRRFAEVRVYPVQDALRALRSGVGYFAVKFYMSVGMRPDLVRALVLLSRGRRKEALAIIRGCLDTCPLASDVPILVAPELDRLGMKKEADEVFDRVFKGLSERCRVEPEVGWRRNELAWMCALCERRLDAALEHAQKAVELVPYSAAFIDTLAEVLFRRGDPDKAVELEERAIKLNPLLAVHVRNLLRYKAARAKKRRASRAVK